MRDVSLILRQAQELSRHSDSVDRVRCVLVHEQRYLLARHNTRRARNRALWGLVGGRLQAAEKPKDGLKRELMEELGCRLRRLVKLGDWLHHDETYRVYGCELRRTIATFDRDEIRAIDWFTYAEVAALGSAEKLRTGFELAAITRFRRHLSAGS
jgi:8-oxo-dGTP pyrophosphatase MutT (NUDIX family)